MNIKDTQNKVAEGKNMADVLTSQETGPDKRKVRTITQMLAPAYKKAPL